MVYFRFPSVLWIFLLKFSGLHYCSIFKVLFIAFYLTTSNVVNGEGGIWTLAPLLTTYSLSRGAPSASLGTSPNTGSYRYRYTSSGRFKAERMGFEPMCPWRQTVFKTASLWPLRYSSVSAITTLFYCISRYFSTIKYKWTDFATFSRLRLYL